MPQIKHNAPKFKYRVYYKKDTAQDQWNIEDIPDWRHKELVIPNQPTFTRYRNEVLGARSALVEWDPVRPDSINGHAKGYKIQTWTRETGEEKYREIIMRSDSTQSLVQSFKPYAVNYARVLAFNGAYNGPASNTITIETPEGQPGPIDLLDCFP